ncbi:hypothetical protein CBM2609_B70338 [Cupriavidus taiwanensis]|uniref:Uncharacterized protein n=1 Tax=Cupriavidus taiwanensis TaxID=164546 RepID=A0A375J4P9_9BURK|nr:hypothetical protein CBM2604_B60335 [Cupriavidus taiwanensis]SOZ33402.1 hypothetical protein CBM2609_B70338 [Cupriavidus taiwanensis]SOZ48714.1 hypothetical protein CBM2610_B50337 [Cupriavidus taiwanensis]SPA01352.1 hypothetical protein CBM2626_B110294 [Cupriavidus taiwanensis]SPR99799.1 hypothetical protein CBM2634_B120009 [Cupriavidus taiwanensis]
MIITFAQKLVAASFMKIHRLFHHLLRVTPVNTSVAMS